MADPDWNDPLDPQSTLTRSGQGLAADDLFLPEPRDPALLADRATKNARLAPPESRTIDQ